MPDIMAKSQFGHERRFVAPQQCVYNRVQTGLVADGPETSKMIRGGLHHLGSFAQTGGAGGKGVLAQVNRRQNW